MQRGPSPSIPQFCPLARCFPSLTTCNPAAQRHPRAALILGVIYFKSVSTRHSPRVFARNSRLDTVSARGEGVSRDVRQASRHFSLAAEAADSLGTCAAQAAVCALLTLQQEAMPVFQSKRLRELSDAFRL
jgi:TPR repeat protein